VRGVSPAKGDFIALQGDQAVIGDRHAVGVAAEITENVLGATEGRFAVDHPVVTEEGAEESSESLRFRQKLEIPVEAELAVVEGPFESGDKLAAENTTQHLSGEEEAIAGVDPALVIGGEATGRDHAMDMGMMFQLLIPTVEHPEEADVGAQMAGITGDFEQGLGADPEQEIVDDLVVLQGQRGKPPRKGAPGGESSDSASVCQYAGANSRTAASVGIAQPDASEKRSRVLQVRRGV